MDATHHLKLPFLMPAQAQKHVTVNESLAELDSLVQCAVLAMDAAVPPASPTEGDRYLLGAAPTGPWAGQAGRLAAWRQNGWLFSAPKPGWRLYNLADDTLYALSAAQIWTPLSGSGSVSEVQNATRIGIGMAADAANPLAAKLNSALLTARTAAEGGTGDLFLACNKPEATRSAGLALQSNFVTRALFGLLGSNRFRLAVSPDGAAFSDALIVHESSGVVDQPRLPRFKAFTNFDNFCAVDTWIKVGINATEANDQTAFDPATNRFTAPVAGTYFFGASLVFKLNASTNARMRGRLVRNETQEITGSFGEISGAHVTNATALWLQTVAALAAGDTVELQGSFRSADAFFAATNTTFWGFKVG